MPSLAWTACKESGNFDVEESGELIGFLSKKTFRKPLPLPTSEPIYQLQLLGHEELSGISPHVFETSGSGCKSGLQFLPSEYSAFVACSEFC